MPKFTTHAVQVIWTVTLNGLVAVESSVSGARTHTHSLSLCTLTVGNLNSLVFVVMWPTYAFPAGISVALQANL